MGIGASYQPSALATGTAFSGHGPDHFFAIATRSEPSLVIDDVPGPTVRRIEGTDLWYAAAKIPGEGNAHTYHNVIEGSLLAAA